MVIQAGKGPGLLPRTFESLNVLVSDDELKIVVMCKTFRDVWLILTPATVIEKTFFLRYL